MTINLTALQKQRRDTAANWTGANPTLLAGEIGIESDTNKIKIGDGSTAWTSLGYRPWSQISAYPIVNADVAAAAAISYSKLATLTSANIVLGSSANVATSTAVTGDVTIGNTGVTAIAANVIVNADVNASAAIAGTKIAPDFGAQTIITTGSGLIGTATSLTTLYSGAGKFQVASNDATTVQGYAFSSTGVDYSATLELSRARGTQASPTIVANGDFIGQINFAGYNTNFQRGATIYALVDGEPGTAGDTTDMPGKLIFATSSNGSATPTTRMSIDSAGAVTLANTLDVPLGTAALPSVAFTGDLNTGIFSPGADQVAITTNGVERVRLSSTGEFMFKGAGTTPGTDKAVSFNGSAPVNSMVLDSSGRLLVGTSSARSNVFLDTVNFTPTIQLESSGSNYNAGLSITQYSASGYSPLLSFGQSASNTAGTNVASPNNYPMGYILFNGNDGTNFRNGSWIGAFADGAASAGSTPGRLTFATTPNGSTSPIGRAMIDNRGVFYMFAAAGGGGHAFMTGEGAGTTYYLFAGFRSATSVGGNNAAMVFQVFTNGNTQNTNNSYAGISDLKLKENIVDATSQWDDLKALQVRKYNFKEETGHQTHTQIGLVAQEVELVSPGLVNESPDRDEDGNDLGTVTKSVNYSVLYMKAVKALQEAMERIETLEQRLTAAGID